MGERILICTDLDRTLLPNGPQPESAGARERLSQVAKRPDVALAYVTGRHRALVTEAIAQFRIPVPDFVIGDVGTTIYSLIDGHWVLWERWGQTLAPDWGGLGHEEIHALVSDLTGDLKVQEAQKQNRFKLSYYAPPDLPKDPLLQALRRRLDLQGIRAQLIWSLDETIPVGLLDVLPASASKLLAIEFLMAQEGFAPERTLFAGDSGNDLPVLVSPIQAVLVANATPEVRAEAVREAERRRTLQSLYLARGTFQGMNGNYSAGILEGLAHFLPETRRWLD